MKKYLWIPVLIILADQATKLRVKSLMNLYDSISVWGDFFRITFVTNTGAAFSFSLGSAGLDRIVFTAAPVLAIALIFYLLSKAETKLSAIAYSLIIGGAVGNLIDRIAYGFVIDFFDFDFFDFIIERWPVFNIADSMVVIAVIILFLDMIIQLVKDKKVTQSTENTIEDTNIQINKESL